MNNPPGDGSILETGLSDNSDKNENSNEATSLNDNHVKGIIKHEPDLENEPDLDILISKVKNELDKVEEVLTSDFTNEPNNFQSILTSALGGKKENESLDKPSEIFKCASCDKVFNNKSSFRRHKIIHSEHKGIFSCELCQKSFSQKTNLNRHNKTVHKQFV